MSRNLVACISILVAGGFAYWTGMGFLQFHLFLFYISVSHIAYAEAF